MDIALSKNLICVICLEVKTRALICRQCFNEKVAGQQVKPETVIVLALKHLLGEHVPFNQGVHLGGSSCAEQIDEHGCTQHTKGAFPDISFRFPAMNLYIEIDEHCHRFYDASCEAARLETSQYGQASDNGKLLPRIMLRFNPNMTNEVSLLWGIKTFAQR
jgi:hypothetical protein